MGGLTRVESTWVRILSNDARILDYLFHSMDAWACRIFYGVVLSSPNRDNECDLVLRVLMTI